MLRKVLCFALCLMLTLPLVSFASAEETVEDPATVTYLDLGEKTMKLEKVMQILDQYPNLQKVDMFGTPVGAKAIEQLEERYPNIEFGWTIKFGDDHRVRTDATAFSTLHLSGSKTHSTKDISLLRYCKHLKALDFGHNGVNDISWLTELPELRVLIIAINRVEDISVLAQLTNLEYLEIFNNYITDIRPLTGLTHLMDLNISYNNIEDLSPLYEMHWLKRLWLYRAKNRNGNKPVTDEEMALLRENLPDCEIDAGSMPTAGTWRKHPHFDVIHAMFRSPDGYAPFEDSWPDDGDETP